MGAWGRGSFENDDALDFCDSLIDSEDLTMIVQAFRSIADSDEYLEAPDCSEALAAAEIVAALKGCPSDQLPEEANEYVQRIEESASAELLQLARDAVVAIRGESELRHLWDETDDVDHWLQAVDDLSRRLES